MTLSEVWPIQATIETSSWRRLSKPARTLVVAPREGQAIPPGDSMRRDSRPLAGIDKHGCERPEFGRSG